MPGGNFTSLVYKCYSYEVISIYANFKDTETLQVTHTTYVVFAIIELYGAHCYVFLHVETTVFVQW